MINYYQENLNITTLQYYNLYYYQKLLIDWIIQSE